MASRVAKNPISIPAGLNVSFDQQHIVFKSNKGELKHQINPAVEIKQVDKELVFTARDDSASANALSGTARALVNNIVIGLTQGFERKLVLVGVGYRAQAQGKQLNVTVGYSHPTVFDVPAGIAIETPSQTEIIVKGVDKHLVGQVAANIRKIRPPELYKGKGIRYHDEVIELKEAKKK